MDGHYTWSGGYVNEGEEILDHHIVPELVVSAALPPLLSDSRALLPEELQNSQILQMPVQHAGTSYISSSYCTVSHLGTIQPTYNTGASTQYPYSQRYTHPLPRQCQINHAVNTYFQPDPTTMECHRNQNDYQYCNAALHMQQHQPSQQQQAYYDSALHYQEGSSWQTPGVVTRNPYQTTNLPTTTSNLFGAIEESQGGNHGELLHGVGINDAPVRLGALLSHSNLSSAVNRTFYSKMLAIARSVPNVWPAQLGGRTEEFSSICVAGADFQPSNPARRSAITLRLRDKEKWRATGSNKMEMVIANGGRRIFPTLTVSVEGLQSNGRYTFFLDLMPKGQNIYRFQSSHWTPLRTLKPYPPPNQASLIHVSRDAYEMGWKLMATGVDFRLAMITNKATTAVGKNQIFAHSMQIYLPRYHIVRHLTLEEVAVRQQSEGACRSELPADLEYVGTYVIPETEFVAVTAYRNRCITEAKINTNPYAKAFRNRQRSSNRPN
uniref:T box transcription factor TBX6 n=1 Tax=Echinococcus granulosus TaxID=6210 RepID=A0A068WY22_ECHGR|nr:T box transcription factor TBX6 [Echinococcus granulosus]